METTQAGLLIATLFYFYNVDAFYAIPDPAMFVTYRTSIYIMACHKIESYITEEMTQDIFYARLGMWITKDAHALQRGFFYGFVPLFIVALFVIDFVASGPPYPLLLLLIWSFQCMHEIHHLAKSYNLCAYYPGVVSAGMLVAHAHLCLFPAFLENLRFNPVTIISLRMSYLVVQTGIFWYSYQKHVRFLLSEHKVCRSVAILGGSRGLGRALALRYRLSGSQVTIFSRTCHQDTDMIGFTAVTCDIANATSLKNAVPPGVQYDVVVLCAGTDGSDGSDIVGTNIHGVINTWDFFDAHIPCGGHAVVVASLAACVTLPEPWALYSASKWFGRTYSLSKAMHSPFDVTIVSPGPFTEECISALAGEIYGRLVLRPREILLPRSATVLQYLGMLAPFMYLTGSRKEVK
jgi:NAD(P)-dependent dehydrogenase (short-subunit alcohol dehydrogenase family)